MSQSTNCVSVDDLDNLPTCIRCGLTMSKSSDSESSNCSCCGLNFNFSAVMRHSTLDKAANDQRMANTNAVHNNLRTSYSDMSDSESSDDSSYVVSSGKEDSDGGGGGDDAKDLIASIMSYSKEGSLNSFGRTPSTSLKSPVCKRGGKSKHKPKKERTEAQRKKDREKAIFRKADPGNSSLSKKIRNKHLLAGSKGDVYVMNETRYKQLQVQMKKRGCAIKINDPKSIAAHFKACLILEGANANSGCKASKYSASVKIFMSKEIEDSFKTIEDFVDTNLERAFAIWKQSESTDTLVSAESYFTTCARLWREYKAGEIFMPRDDTMSYEEFNAANSEHDLVASVDAQLVA